MREKATGGGQVLSGASQQGDVTAYDKVAALPGVARKNAQSR